MDFIKIFQRLHQQLDLLIQSLDRTKATQPTAEEYVDGVWIQERFDISKQTLSDYRRKGVIPYTYFAERGKIYYRIGDIYEILEKNFTGRNRGE